MRKIYARNNSRGPLNTEDPAQMPRSLPFKSTTANVDLYDMQWLFYGGSGWAMPPPRFLLAPCWAPQFFVLNVTFKFV